MSSFSEAAVESKFATLNDSTESIQTVSHWLAYHHKHYKTYVEVWRAQVQKASPTQMLRLLYVANDLIQVNRKKFPHLISEFARVFLESVPLAHKAGDAKIQKAVKRLVDVWAERQLFESSYISSFRRGMNDTSSNNSYTPPHAPPVKSIPSSSLTPLVPSNGLVEELRPIETLMRNLESTTADDSKLLEQVRALPDHIFSKNISSRLQSKTQLEDELDIISSAALSLAKAEGRLAAQTEDRQALIDMLSALTQRQQAVQQRALEALDECRQKSSVLTEIKKQTKNKMDQLASESLFVTPPPMMSSADIFGTASDDQYNPNAPASHYETSSAKLRQQDQRYSPY